MMVKSSKLVQALQARADSQMTGEGSGLKPNRSLVVRSTTASLRTVGVLHTASQKGAEQRAAHINVALLTHNQHVFLENIKRKVAAFAKRKWLNSLAAR